MSRVSPVFRNVLWIVLSVPTYAARADYARMAVGDVGWDQRLGAKLPLEEVLVDESGKPYRLASSFAGKPVILTFAYFRCPNLCTLVLNGVTDALQKLKEKPGKDFELLTVSMDPRENPKLALMKRRTYLARLGAIPEPGSGWRFLTGDQAAIARLTGAAGFRFRPDRASGEFAHPSGLLVLSPDGAIRQYMMGIRFDPAELSRALERASRFRGGSLAEQVRLFCLHYDPSSSPLSAAILSAVRVSGALFALGLAAALVRAFRRDRREEGKA